MVFSSLSTPDLLALSSLPIDYHIYAMLMTLKYFFPSPKLSRNVTRRISACMNDISSRIEKHHLKLNPAKTEILYLLSTSSPSSDFSITLGDTILSSAYTAKNLGVVGGSVV